MNQGNEIQNLGIPSIEKREASSKLDAAPPFTRGPWTAQRITVDGGVRFKINSPGKWIELASVYTNPFATARNKGDGEANARLIAAAPALYEALREARQMIFDLRGRAFVGSHVPRSKEPLLAGGTALDAKIDAALALATVNTPAR